MKIITTLTLLFVAILQLAVALPLRAQANSSQTAKASDDPTEQNLDAYIDLMRKDVRQQKAQIMGAIMALSTDDAAKFWPIYSEYDAELSKLSKQRTDNIKEYARTYDQLTDAKADELIKNAMAYQKQRGELLAKTYERMKQSLGAVTAARFAQVENQLLLIIDLQIVSALPIVAHGS